MPQQFHPFISSQEKMHVHTKTCMQMFINYSPKLETSKFLLTAQWIDKNVIVW